MTALCSRVDCDEPAVAVFGFDAMAALVWLDPFDGSARGAGMLCAAHADTLTPMRGWTLQDRRMPAPRLWAERPRITTPARTSTRRPRRPYHQHQEPTDPLPFDARSTTAEVSTDFERLLDARTPLLTRAFQAARGRDH